MSVDRSPDVYEAEHGVSVSEVDHDHTAKGGFRDSLAAKTRDGHVPAGGRQACRSGRDVLRLVRGPGIDLAVERIVAIVFAAPSVEPHDQQAARGNHRAA